ncbi:MAG: ChaN family lipoprotein [Planctomycetes bacterium]|nr:ChaN family lipoprotein [Planctomycetota bacterium]
MPRSRRFPDEEGSPSTFARLAADAARAEVVLVGDFHGFLRAQENFLHLARALAARGDLPALALEAFASSGNRVLARFLRGSLAEGPFLRLCRLRRTWPFDLKGLLRILRWARRSASPVSGIDAPGDVARRSRPLRERRLAAAIENALARRRNRPLLVLVGQTHLPALAGLLARRRVLTVSFVAGRPQGAPTHVFRRSPSGFAVRGFSPLLAEQEFLDRGALPGDSTDRVADHAARLARTLGAPPPDPSGIGVVEDRERLRRAGRLALRDGSQIFVRGADPCAAAEAASLALAPRRSKRAGPLSAFLEEVREAALGFLSTRLLDPHRVPRPPHRHLPRSAGFPPGWASALRGIRRGLARWLDRGEAGTLRACLSAAPPAVGAAAARSLGEVLASRWTGSRLPRRSVRRLLLSGRPSSRLAPDLRRAFLRPRRSSR